MVLLYIYIYICEYINYENFRTLIFRTKNFRMLFFKISDNFGHFYVTWVNVRNLCRMLEILKINWRFCIFDLHLAQILALFSLKDVCFDPRISNSDKKSSWYRRVLLSCNTLFKYHWICTTQKFSNFSDGKIFGRFNFRILLLSENESVRKFS